MSQFTFSCPACGRPMMSDTANAGATGTCPSCQRAIIIPQPYASAKAPAPFPSAHQTVPRRASGLAIASFICSVFLCVGCIPGIICGHLARRKIRHNPGLGGGGLAIAGLILSYLSLLASLGAVSLMVLFWQDFKDAFNDAMQENSSVTISHNDSPDDSKPDTSATPDPLWKLDLADAEFPDQPAAGKIHGLDFVAGTVSVQNGVITFHQSANHQPAQLLMFTFLKDGETLAGKSWNISDSAPDNSVGPTPLVHLRWKNGRNAKSKAFPTGYALKLEFGDAQTDGSIPGKIYVCLPDDEKSYVAGSFTVKPAKAKKKPKAPAN